MATDKINQTLRLSDGRNLGFAERGQPDGSPIFYFTGGNSSRLEFPHWEDVANQLGIRLIIPDRPGFGLSDFHLNRTLLDWTNDVGELADHLDINKFAVFGLSGGGPHVASVAFAIPERLTKVSIVSGTAPPEMPNRFKGMWFPIQLIFRTARFLPALNRFALKQMGRFYTNEEQMRKRMLQAMPQPDIDLLSNHPQMIADFSKSAQEAHRNGIEGDAWEWQLYVRPWGFALSDIQVEVGLWYGEVDRNVPVGMGRYLHEQLPNSQLHIVPDGGHFSTINNYIEDILRYLSA